MTTGLVRLPDGTDMMAASTDLNPPLPSAATVRLVCAWELVMNRSGTVMPVKIWCFTPGNLNEPCPNHYSEILPNCANHLKNFNPVAPEQVRLAGLPSAARSVAV